MAAFALALTALALSAPAAQATAPDDDNPIVVTATAEQELKDFVDALTPKSGQQGQLARFERSVCPLAAGVSATQKEAIGKRMRDVAKAAGLKAGGADCSPNVLVLIVNDKKATIEKLAKQYPDVSGDLTSKQWRELLNSTAPAVAWHLKGPPINADGHELGETAGGFYINRTGRAGSRITSATHPQFSAAVVVIDSSALQGLTTTQVADYAAMRGFLDIDPEKIEDSSIPTILTILSAPDNAEIPVTLTNWDLEALRGYYSANRNVSVTAQRSEIRDSVQQKAAGGDKPVNR